MLTADEKNELDEELRTYQIDEKHNWKYDLWFKFKSYNLNHFKYGYSENSQTYWWIVRNIQSVITFMKVKKKKNVILEKLVKAAILCFHRRGGLQFDGKHNYNHRTSLEVESLDSYQAIKYYLKVNDISSLEVFY